MPKKKLSPLMGNIRAFQNKYGYVPTLNDSEHKAAFWTCPRCKGDIYKDNPEWIRAHKKVCTA